MDGLVAAAFQLDALGLGLLEDALQLLDLLGCEQGAAHTSHTRAGTSFTTTTVSPRSRGSVTVPFS